MTRSIFVAVDLPEDLMDRVRSAARDGAVSSAPCRTSEELARHMPPGTEVLLTRHALPDPASSPRLRWVQSFGAGIDHLRYEPLCAAGIQLTATNGIHAACAAELVFAFILHFQKNLARIQAYREQRRWPVEADLFRFFDRPELATQTLGVVGLGAIGSRVAHLGAAFGMRVLGIRRRPQEPPRPRYDPWGIELLAPPEVVGIDGLEEVAGRSDFLVLCLPHTGETRLVVSREILARMKPSAVLINVSRGAVLDEEALVEALRAGTIAGAGLDVFRQEPLPPDHPFYSMENVVVSPHVGGATPRYVRLVVDLFVANLARYLNGQPLLNLVEWQRRY